VIWICIDVESIEWFDANDVESIEWFDANVDILGKAMNDPKALGE